MTIDPTLSRIIELTLTALIALVGSLSVAARARGKQRVYLENFYTANFSKISDEYQKLLGEFNRRELEYRKDLDNAQDKLEKLSTQLYAVQTEANAVASRNATALDTLAASLNNLADQTRELNQKLPGRWLKRWSASQRLARSITPIRSKKPSPLCARLLAPCLKMRGGR